MNIQRWNFQLTLAESLEMCDTLSCIKPEVLKYTNCIVLSVSHHFPYFDRTSVLACTNSPADMR